MIGQILGVGVANEAKEQRWLQHHFWNKVTIVRRALVANVGDKFKKKTEKGQMACTDEEHAGHVRRWGGLEPTLFFFILAECGTPLSLHVT